MSAESYLPEHVGKPDWVLVCTDEELPCHGAVLAALSPVLEGLGSTKPREDGKVAVPFRHAASLGHTLLHWAYKNRFHEGLEVSEAKLLAPLANEWNISGLALQCDSVLAHEASQPTSQTSPPTAKLSGRELLDLAVLASSCGLAETLSCCEFHIILRYAEVVTNPKLSQLSGPSMQRILLGVMAHSSEANNTGRCWACYDSSNSIKTLPAGELQCVYCPRCGNLMSKVPSARRQQLAAPSLQKLRGWAHQTEEAPSALLELSYR